MDYVLLSPNDGELLKKAHQMLLDGGVMDDKEWNERINPDVNNNFTKEKGRLVLNYALLICIDGRRGMEYHTHECTRTIPITLTPENLTESVNTVLAEYKKAQGAGK